MTTHTEPAVAIEAAICPFRADAPVLPTETLAEEAISCLEAGAAIVHHHHDTRLERDAAIEALISFSKQVISAQPSALLYPGILAGKKQMEHVGHLEPMADENVLGFAPVDPGAAVPYDLTEEGVPTGYGYVWNSFSAARRVAEMMLPRGLPLTIGVYEPVQLRWALAMEKAGKLAPGSMIKLYFGGRYSIQNIGHEAINFGLPPTKQALDMYLSMMEGSRLPWNVGVMGDALIDTPLAQYALEKGGHLRVGIEDMGGVRDITNAESVREAVALCGEVGRPVANCEQAAELFRSA